MARSLLEGVKKQLAGPAEQPGMQDEGQKAQQLLRAKLGKARAPGATPRRSAIQEQQQVQQAKMGGKQMQQEGRLAAEQVEQRQIGQQAQEAEQRANIMEQRKDLTANFERQSENIMRDLERGHKKMTSQERAAKLEQVGFTVRLQNEQYMHKLQSEGRKARLDNDLSFREQLARTNFKDQQELLENNIFMKSVSDASDREYQRILASMEPQHAYNMAKQEMRREGKRAMWEGISQLGSSALGAGMASGGGGGAGGGGTGGAGGGGAS